MNTKPQTQVELAAAFLGGAAEGVKGALSIEGDEMLSFGWYPIARRVGPVIWLRRQMYSEATARQIKAVQRALVTSGYIETGKIDEPSRDRWWSWEKATREEGEREGRGGR